MSSPPSKKEPPPPQQTPSAADASFDTIAAAQTSPELVSQVQSVSDLLDQPVVPPSPRNRTMEDDDELAMELRELERNENLLRQELEVFDDQYSFSSSTSSDRAMEHVFQEAQTAPMDALAPPTLGISPIRSSEGPSLIRQQDPGDPSPFVRSTSRGDSALQQGRGEYRTRSISLGNDPIRRNLDASMQASVPIQTTPSSLTQSSSTSTPSVPITQSTPASQSLLTGTFAAPPDQTPTPQNSPQRTMQQSPLTPQHVYSPQSGAVTPQPVYSPQATVPQPGGTTPQPVYSQQAGSSTTTPQPAYSTGPIVPSTTTTPVYSYGGASPAATTPAYSTPNPFDPHSPASLYSQQSSPGWSTGGDFYASTPQPAPPPGPSSPQGDVGGRQLDVSALTWPDNLGYQYATSSEDDFTARQYASSESPSSARVSIGYTTSDDEFLQAPQYASTDSESVRRTPSLLSDSDRPYSTQLIPIDEPVGIGESIFTGTFEADVPLDMNEADVSQDTSMGGISGAPGAATIASGSYGNTRMTGDGLQLHLPMAHETGDLEIYGRSPDRSMRRARRRLWSVLLLFFMGLIILLSVVIPRARTRSPDRTTLVSGPGVSVPTVAPTRDPDVPTDVRAPTESPTPDAAMMAVEKPTRAPSKSPSTTSEPTLDGALVPTPSNGPVSIAPNPQVTTDPPSTIPPGSMLPQLPTSVPTLQGSSTTSARPTSMVQASGRPSLSPSTESPVGVVPSTRDPTLSPSIGASISTLPTSTPTTSPTIGAPTAFPSTRPTMVRVTPSPTGRPTVSLVSSSPTRRPTTAPVAPPPTFRPTNPPIDIIFGTGRPTAQPTVELVESSAPSNAPTPLFTCNGFRTFDRDLFYFLIDRSVNGSSSSLRDCSSPEYAALEWLSQDSRLPSFDLTNGLILEDPRVRNETYMELMAMDDRRDFGWSEEELLERYALAIFYFASDGPNWVRTDNWLSERHICHWHSDANRGACDRNKFKRLVFFENKVSGRIPRELALLSTHLEEVSLQGSATHRLSGTLPVELGLLSNLYEFRLNGNDITGPIPRSYSRLTELEVFDVSVNNLSGSMEFLEGGMYGLVVLNVAQNLIGGTIPDALSKSTNLEALFIQNNRMEGALPKTISSLGRLKLLKAAQNKLTEIPMEIGGLRSLRYLDLSENMVAGPLSNELVSLRKLEHLSLAGNQMSGFLPKEISWMNKLESLDLSNNEFSGTIPSEFGDLGKKLTRLNLSGNRLEGMVPEELGWLDKLESLSLHSNDLTGTVPIDACKTFERRETVVSVDCNEVACSCCSSCNTGHTYT